MPDWFAHIMLGVILSTCLRLTREKRVLFLIGTVMPDLVRLLYLISSLLDFQSFTTLVASPLNNSTHSLLGVLVYSMFISVFFEPSLDLEHSMESTIKVNAGHVFLQKWQKTTSKPIFLLVLGGIAHLFLDTFMYPYGGGIYWLYPVTIAMFRWSFKAWWPSSLEAIIVLAPFFLVSLIVEFFIILAKKKGYLQRSIGTTAT
jgi:hypothetical protein